MPELDAKKAPTLRGMLVAAAYMCAPLIGQVALR